MTTKFKILLTAIVILQMSSANAAIDYSVQEGNSHLSFEATGRPSMLKIKGNGGNMQGHFSIAASEVQGEIQLDLNSLDTGIDLRDKHMKEKYLQVEKYPKAVLKIKNLKIGESELSKTVHKEFDGLLTLHGVEQPVHGTFEIKNSNEVEAQFDIKLSDFKIAIPSYMGVTIADLVQVQSQFHLEKVK